jgi:hypothetical protein
VIEPINCDWSLKICHYNKNERRYCHYLQESSTKNGCVYVITI